MKVPGRYLRSISEVPVQPSCPYLSLNLEYIGLWVSGGVSRGDGMSRRFDISSPGGFGVLDMWRRADLLYKSLMDQ